MAITFERTTLGLLVNSGIADSQLISMNDFQLLFDLFDANPNLQNELKTELIQQFTDMSNEIIENLNNTTIDESQFIDLKGFYALLTSVQQYAIQVAPQYRQFKAAIERARNGD